MKLEIHSIAKESAVTVSYVVQALASWAHKETEAWEGARLPTTTGALDSQHS